MTLAPLQHLIVPVVLAIGALLLRDRLQALPAAYLPLLDALPYITLCMALLLGYYNNRARLFTAVLALLLAYYLVQAELQVSLADFRAWFIYTALSVCLPFTLLLMFILPERGLRNRYGLMLVMTIPLQAVAGAVIYHFIPGNELSTIMNRFFSTWLHPRYLLSFYASIGFIVVLLTGLVMLFRDRTEATAALLGILLMTWITLAGLYLEKISVVMFSAAGLAVFISLLRSAHAMAYRDDLTGLLGRRALNERLKGLGGRYVIAMLDVDHFKIFNDTYGHDVGDEVLKMVARQVDSVRGGGTAYRYGGEEFCIVFAGKETGECAPFLESLRAQVGSYKMVLRDKKSRAKTRKSVQERRGRRRRGRNGKTVSVTISIGAAAPDEKHNKPETVLKAADGALYKAKKRGRNRLVISE